VVPCQIFDRKNVSVSAPQVFNYERVRVYISEREFLGICASLEGNSRHSPYGTVRTIAARKVFGANPLLTTVSVPDDCTDLVGVILKAGEFNAALDHGTRDARCSPSTAAVSDCAIKRMKGKRVSARAIFPRSMVTALPVETGERVRDRAAAERGDPLVVN